MDSSPARAQPSTNPIPTSACAPLRLPPSRPPPPRRVRVLGDDVRILRCYPGQWQVHYAPPPGAATLLLSCEDACPSYERIVALLKSVPGTRCVWF